MNRADWAVGIFILLSSSVCVGGAVWINLEMRSIQERQRSLRSFLESQGYTFQIVSINSPVFTIEDKTLEEFLTHLSEIPYPRTIFVKETVPSTLYTFSEDLKIGYSYTVK